MDYGKLTINQPLRSRGITVNFKLNENGQIWQTIPEIARNLDCFLSAVYSNIRVLLKNEELYIEEVCKEVTYFDDKGNERIMTVYNLDMIIALAFRIKSHRAREFRKWVRKIIISPIRKREVILIDTSKLNKKYSS